MKAYIALACLAAVALAEPYGYGYRGGYYGRGGYGYRGGYGGRYYGKRSADAESEPKADAEPWVTYGGLGYAGYASPYTYGYAAYPTAYTGYTGLLHYGYGKRSADAEPKADAYYGYSGYYGYAR